MSQHVTSNSHKVWCYIVLQCYIVKYVQCAEAEKILTFPGPYLRHCLVVSGTRSQRPSQKDALPAKANSNPTSSQWFHFLSILVDKAHLYLNKTVCQCKGASVHIWYIMKMLYSVYVYLFKYCIYINIAYIYIYIYILTCFGPFWTYYFMYSSL